MNHLNAIGVCCILLATAILSINKTVALLCFTIGNGSFLLLFSKSRNKPQVFLNSVLLGLNLFNLAKEGLWE